MEVYGIYEGCVFEGGGVHEPLYKSKDEAIAGAKKVFEENQKKHKEMFDRNEYKTTALNHYEQYRWKVCDNQENRWHNTVNEIQVLTYTVK